MMAYRVALTRVSKNVKTGPIPVSTSDASTCPPTCEQFDTCYAKFGSTSIHWDKVNAGERGMDWDSFCDEVSRLPRKQFWRHNQAGDLPGDGRIIDAGALALLVAANKGRRGFTYTHYPLAHYNVAAIEAANRDGFTINISCDSLEQADVVSIITEAPLAVVLHSYTKEHALYTPAGRKVVVCPATYRDDMNCANCEICYDSSAGRAIIGFPAHGTRKRVIDARMSR